MLNKNTILKLQLQLFAEGGGAEGGTGAEGTTGEMGAAAVPQKKGAKSNPLAEVKYGIQDDAPAAEVQQGEVEPDRNAEFEKLIKGEYKDLYDARMQKTIQERLKSSKEIVEKYNSLQSTLEILANKYGVKADDVDALNKAIEEDDSYFEDEALEKGITVEQLKEIRRMERENADLKRQMSEQQTQENASRIYAGWLQQAEEAKAVYPSFNLDAELANQQFVDLLRAQIPVRTAYEVIHKDDIIPAAMQFTAKTIEQKLVNKIVAGGARPTENGLNSQSASLTKSDVSQLTKADRKEIVRRVMNGEKIRF